MTEKTQHEADRGKVNLETAQIAWKEWLRFFASGAAIFVSDDLDLVEVAVKMSEDNAQQVEHWMASRLIVKVSDEQARGWHGTDAVVWAVVVSPYVLMQRGHAKNSTG